MLVTLKALPARLSARFDFPVDRDTLLAGIGDWVVEAPDPAESERLADVLNRSGASHFVSEADLLETILCNLSDEYVGRKYYDDRGSNPFEMTTVVPNDPIDQSF